MTNTVRIVMPDTSIAELKQSPYVLWIRFNEHSWEFVRNGKTIEENIKALGGCLGQDDGLAALEALGK